MRIDILLHGLRIKYFGDAGFFVAATRLLVACQVADGSLRHAGVVIAVAAHASAGAGRSEFAGWTLAGTDVGADGAGFVISFVLQIARTESAAGFKLVALLVDGLLGAGDGAAC